MLNTLKFYNRRKLPVVLTATQMNNLHSVMCYTDTDFSKCCFGYLTCKHLVTSLHWDKSQSLAFVKQYLGSISPVMKAGAYSHVQHKLPKHWCWVPKRWYWVLELNRERRWDLHSPLDLAKNYLPLHISSDKLSRRPVNPWLRSS